MVSYNTSELGSVMVSPFANASFYSKVRGCDLCFGSLVSYLHDITDSYSAPSS